MTIHIYDIGPATDPDQRADVVVDSRVQCLRALNARHQHLRHPRHRCSHI